MPRYLLFLLLLFPCIIAAQRSLDGKYFISEYITCTDSNYQEGHFHLFFEKDSFWLIHVNIFDVCIGMSWGKYEYAKNGNIHFFDGMDGDEYYFRVEERRVAELDKNKIIVEAAPFKLDMGDLCLVGEQRGDSVLYRPKAKELAKGLDTFSMPVNCLLVDISKALGIKFMGIKLPATYSYNIKNENNYFSIYWGILLYEDYLKVRVAQMQLAKKRIICQQFSYNNIESHSLAANMGTSDAAKKKRNCANTKMDRFFIPQLAFELKSKPTAPILLFWQKAKELRLKLSGY